MQAPARLQAQTLDRDETAAPLTPATVGATKVGPSTTL
jgi:hypothetical protein